jgi:two-component system, sensor histidine kinase
MDTGCGIAQEQLSTIFDEFVQLNNPQRDASQGVGLGLATVKRICALLEHPLSVVSQLERGSRFSLGLAVAPAPDLQAAQSLSSRGQALLRGSVLLIEDNDLVRESLLHSLREWGLDCTACADASQAQAALAGSSFDVVLSDWRLAGELRGDALLQAALDQTPHDQRAPLCLLMTGETDDSLGALDARITLLRKPVRPIRLRALLSAYLMKI